MIIQLQIILELTKSNVCLAGILEPCILDLDALEQLGGTVDTVSK